MTMAELIRQWRSDPVLFVRDNFSVDPDIWQAKVLNAFASRDKNKLRLAMRACAGPGKAQPKEMLFDTPDGVRRFGDLKIGDMVFAESGRPTPITGVYDRGVRTVYRIFFNDGSSTLACGEHLWKVKGRTERRHWQFDSSEHTEQSWRSSFGQRKKRLTNGGWSVISTEEIIKRNSCQDGNRRQFEIPRQKAVEYPEALLPIDPYVLGVWLGDGSRNRTSYTGIDQDIDNMVRERGYIVKEFGQEKRVTGLYRSLRLIGISGKYSFEKSVPREYKYASIKQRLDILRGIMDTDGTIGTDNHCELAITSERLAEDVVWLVRSLGGFAKIKNAKSRKYYRDKQGNKVVCRVCYRVTVSMDVCPFYLPRKAKRWHVPQDRYLKRYIDRIEQKDIKDTMCISVADDSHCYLCNDFIVTHNTAVLAWCGWNFLACYGERGHHPVGACVSVTADNLKDNLWPEFSRWQQRSKFLSEAFVWTKERIFSKDHPTSWWLSARTYPKSADKETIGRTLSGLHSKYILYLIDEGGDIPPSILRSAEQGLSTDVEFGRILVAGNPTSLDGVLYVACVDQADSWYVVTITGDPDDPERSPRIDIEWARDQIKKWGRENPWVMSYILGLFPPASINQLIGLEEVENAMNRVMRPDVYDWAQKRLGIDVARFGDDRTVIFPRQGLCAFQPAVMRHNAATDKPSVDIANRVMMAKAKWGCEREFMDDSGGWSHGAIDVLRAAGHSPTGIQFAGKAIDPRYYNKRAEMWIGMVNWIREGGKLPRIPELKRELTAPTYTFVNGKFLIEPKDQIKVRLGVSPDLADALALTFAEVEQPSMATDFPFNREKGKLLSEYDPFEEKRLG